MGEREVRVTFMKVTVERDLLPMLIEDFEHFLESHGINVPNEEKEQSECPSTIYGSHYAELEDDIEATLSAFDIYVEPFYNDFVAVEEDGETERKSHDPIHILGGVENEHN